MSKKIIKYLIWTIIIAAVLVLMPIKETKAVTVTYNQFQTSKNHFCLNKGFPFYNEENFNNSVISGNSFTFPNSNNKTVVTNVLKYIISEANKSGSAYANRVNINSYIPQIAIWKLAGYNLYNEQADRLIADAYAYDNFVKAESPIPTVEKYGTDSFAIKYYIATATYNGINGSYTNFSANNVRIAGAHFVKTENSGGGYYRNIYTKNSGAIAATISKYYETRSANLELYTSEERIAYVTKTNSLYDKDFLKIGESSYKCMSCNNLDCMRYCSDWGSVEGITAGWRFDNIKKEDLVKDFNDYWKYYYCENCNDLIAVNGNQCKHYYYGGVEVERIGLSFITEEIKNKPQNLLYGTGEVAFSGYQEFKFIQPVTLNFNKQDFNGNRVNGATINISGVNNVGSLSANSITIGNGSVTVTPANGNSGTFTIGLTENELTGYQTIPYTTLTVSYNNGVVTGITSSNSTFVPVSGNTVTIKNKPQVDLIINKTDPLIGGLANARFKIELTNVESMEKYHIPEAKNEETQNSPTMVYVKTDENGQIKLTGIVPTGGQEGTITATITEVEVPTANGYYYKLLENPITVTMTYDNGTWTEEGIGSISGNVLTVEIQNQPYIDLSGNVWQDGQTGVKDVSGPDGEKNPGENGLKDVIVELYSVKESKVIRTTTTDLNGNYTFKDVPRTLEGFIVMFKYNGITYVETPMGTVSKPSEISRETFNNRFKTISAGKSNDGTTLEYTYNNISKTSALNATIAGHTIGTTDAAFQISAQTVAYNTTASDINCGLVNKNFDLAIGTDVKEAIIKVNEKETKYTYAQIMDGQLNADFQNNSSTAEDVIYNLYLYSSDYNYRINDYKTDIRGNNVPDGDNNNIADYEGIKNLEAYVTYSVILKNQTTHNARVDEFVYYYDAAYKPYQISTSEYNYSIDTNARKITFTIKDNIKFNLTNPNYRVEVDLTFEINKDSEGNLVVDKTATNVAEITRYSTDEGGLIDGDSAPGNGITNGRITQYEDDTDEAKGLNIILRTDETRRIEGTVFDDTFVDEAKTEYDKDGKLNNSNTSVNDVIVQLIEIKKIGGVYYEYIWQETRSGSNTVKRLSEDGNVIDEITYRETAPNDGSYVFADFIPGDYIIRFIYGDGRTLDVNSQEYKNVAEYNGQDYKSTKDPNYKQPWYNTSTYDVGSSVARDNEARRLEVMAYSSIINETNGAELANKTPQALDATWMCAETSRINIPVDNVEYTKMEIVGMENYATTASYDYTKNNIKVIFGDMNFGLALRPQTNIVLEKHITSLKITPSGTGVLPIVDAKALDIEKIVNGEEVQVKGITTGLATIKSTAENRGFWQVATDVEELMQGAELEVEYTYVLRNDSEPDYLSSQLVNEYETNTTGYSNYLLNIVAEGQGNLKNNTKGKTDTYGTYLGQFYYTGEVGSDDTLVTSRIEKFEEALNNDLTFNESEATVFDIARENSKYNVYGVNKVDGTKEIEINTVIQNKTVTPFLLPKSGETHKTTTETEKGTADWSRTLKLTTTLSTVAGGELGANLPSYIAEIMQYSNAAGRKDMEATPANLSYVHSDDSDMTMTSDNEQDEFWAESIIITKPTGENKVTPLQIALIAISSIAALGVGIVLIKKFVLNK